MPSQRRIWFYVDVIRRLGFFNVAYVAWYRFTLKSGIRKRFFPQHSFTVDPPFFHPGGCCSDYPDDLKEALFEGADKIIQGQLRYYAYHWKTVGNPPNCFLNPFNGRLWPNPRQHWTALSDFNTGIGDIKNVWESSRFEWVVTLARAYAVSGKAVYLDTLNQWLSDWAENNPVNTGPNWKCGQEAAIRVFNLMQAALILGQWDQPSPVLKNFIYHHLERISANIRYAIAQDNNHGTSEAAALFIGGHWSAKIYSLKPLRKKCDHFARQGRKWLENRIRKLVESDGSFSQHSVTYHRVSLDTLTFTEYWRRKFRVAPFSDSFYQRAEAVIQWMCMVTDRASGKAPNLGANDGSLFLNTHSCDYRDFRPNIQTASVLFKGKRFFDEGPWDEPSYWFGLDYKNAEHGYLEKKNAVLPGGYVIMAGKDSWGMLRFPMFRFRPSHNDVFHFDLWYKGENICRDAGSYSYNPENEADGSYFKSVKAHNTVSFNEHEQMPRLDRFMLGKWLRADHVGPIEQAEDGGFQWKGAYHDYRGNHHCRRVAWCENSWLIEDHFDGDFQEAGVRYRLSPGTYKVEGHKVLAPWGTIEIETPGCQVRLETGFESLYYWEKTPVPTLVISVGRSDRKVVARFRLTG